MYAFIRFLYCIIPVVCGRHGKSIAVIVVWFCQPLFLAPTCFRCSPRRTMRLRRGSSIQFSVLLLLVCCGRRGGGQAAGRGPWPASLILLTETGECGPSECGGGCTSGDCPRPSVSCELGSRAAEQAATWVVRRLRQLALTNISTGEAVLCSQQAC
jgi:hypothetical protein